MPSRHVDRDPVEGLGRASAGLVRHPQALGQQQLQPVAPMAQVRALVREDVLEKPLAGEELEIRVMDPALALTLIGQPAKCLEQQQPDHGVGLDPRRPSSL